MKRLLVVYHSQSGSTRRLAQAVYDGARQDAVVEVTLKRAMEASATDLLAADAVLFGTPENLGYISGGLKDFFDRSFYAMPEAGLLPYGIFISAGNDGSGAEKQLQRILKGYRMKAVADSLIVRGELSDTDLNKASELGALMAAGLEMGIF